MSQTNRELVEYYLNCKLSQSNCPSLLGASRSSPVSSRDWSGASPSTDAVKAALRNGTDAFERRMTPEWSVLSSYLDLNVDHQKFKDLMDQIFSDNTHWGLVVGLFVISGAMCVRCVEKGQSEMVPRIADWMTAYLDQRLNPWIQSQGGWVSVRDRFKKKKKKQTRTR